MLFSSLVFLYSFLPILLLTLLVLPKTWHNGCLLLASLIFYAWGGVSYTAILVLSIVLNYGFGRWIAASGEKKKAKSILIIGIGLNLIILLFFKYALFFLSQLNFGLKGLGIVPVVLPKIILPLGISFFTFQGISYLVDVYRKTTAVQKRLDRLGLYIALFPQLIAGPIVRYHDLAGQLGARNLGWGNIGQGLERFIIGLSKKVLLANNFALVADAIFSAQPESLSWPIAWLGMLVYALQIYFDFSGYSDIAVGCAYLLGIRLPWNFRTPYMSLSPREFWQRWHITLSTWIRDYLYIPLGGNRGGQVRQLATLLFVMGLAGLWHGADQTFIYWGLGWGAYIALARLLGNSRIGGVLARARPLVWIGHMLAIVVLWVLFRAPNMDAALNYLQAMVALDKLGTPERAGMVMLGAMGLMLLHVAEATYLQTTRNIYFLRRINGPFVWGLFTGMCLWLVLLPSYDVNPFIYFRF